MVHRDARNWTLDGLKESDSGTDVYVEPKNRRTVTDPDTVDKIEAQIIRYLAWKKIEGRDLSKTTVTVYVRKESQVSELETKLGETFRDDVFEVKTSP